MSSLKAGFRLLCTEMVLTKMLIAMSIMTPFFYSIGMSQGDIGLSQMMFNAALLLANLPTGRLADRFSRKWCNFAGDITMCLSLLLYSQATGFWPVVGCEMLFGLGAAFSQGADSGLFRAFCRLLSGSDKRREASLLHHYNGLIGIIQPLVQAGAVFGGGLIGAQSYRLAIGLSAVPYAVGALCMLGMREVGDKSVTEHKNLLRDILSILRRTKADRTLLWTLISYAVGREVSHVMVWGATPLLMLVGVSPLVIAVAWTINALVASIASLIARLYAERLPEWLRFMLPAGLVLVALTIMSVHLSTGTIWLYAVMGLSQGWTSVTLAKAVQWHAPHDSQATAMSTAGSLAQLLYLLPVWLIGELGTIDIRLTMPAIVIMFAPLVIVTATKLWRVTSR